MPSCRRCAAGIHVFSYGVLPELPGEAPGAVGVVVVALLVGAGEGDIVPPEALIGALIPLILLGFGVVLPEDDPGGTVVGEDIAELSGAGALVCANAKPTEHKTATAAN